MIDFSTCKNCGRAIFFDWKGEHHVQPADTSCPRAEEAAEDDDEPKSLACPSSAPENVGKL